MGLHEQARDTGGHGRAGEHGNEFALSARGISLAARQLHGVRGVEHHGTAGGAHHRERAHVRHQVVVAEREAALAHQDLAVAGGARLVDDVLHLPGTQELALLDVDGLALRAGRDDEVRLSAQKRRRLQHVDHLRHLRERRVLVNVGQHGNADLLAHLRKRLQALLEPGSAKALARGAIGLVEGGLENERNAERRR